ncbi:MAG: hypothetical protein O7D86_03450 [Proteobacteria bacterium]|nr:hypothetical protein [Pseudomonadota bacterium]
MTITDLTGRQSLSSVRLEIQKIDYLPPMPAIAQEILIACNDDTSDMDDIQYEEIQVSDVLRKADRALYYVKQHGRNNVKSFSEIP